MKSCMVQDKISHKWLVQESELFVVCVDSYKCPRSLKSQISQGGKQLVSLEGFVDNAKGFKMICKACGGVKNDRNMKPCWMRNNEVCDGVLSKFSIYITEVDGLS